MRVAVAGTFGPVHDGHRALFEHALRFGDEGVLVALTSDELAEATRTKPRPIPPFEDRRRLVEDAIDELDQRGRDVEIWPLEDEHGIASAEPSLDALVLSPETAAELEAINARRRERDLEALTGIVVPYVLAHDGERISSTRIVEGEVDEHGRLLE